VPEPRLNEKARGVYVIAVTPFTDTGTLDFASVDTMVEFYADCGASGMTILGVMGEAPKMMQEEAEAFVARTIKAVRGRFPVVVGVTSPALEYIKALTHRSMELGAAGVMLQPLQGLKGDDAVYDYFATVFKALGSVPVCVQDYPVASGVHLAVPVWNRLVDNFPQVVMLKHEDLPGLAKLSRVRADEQRDKRRRVSILVGNNGLYLPQELRRGADGAMTGFAFPDVLVRVIELFADNRFDEAEDLFDIYLPINRHEQQPGIGLAIRKETLRRRGAIASATARYPAAKLTPYDHDEISALLARIERRIGRESKQAAQ
jgi:4-hydroxy-tetrahydrodipicolinate synthase